MSMSVCSAQETEMTKKRKPRLVQRRLWYAKFASACPFVISLHQTLLTSCLPVQSVRFSPDLNQPDTSVLLTAKTSPLMQLSTSNSRSSTPLPELYSPNRTVSKLTKTSSLMPAVDWVRDTPVRAKSSLLAGWTLLCHFFVCSCC